MEQKSEQEQQTNNENIESNKSIKNRIVKLKCDIFDIIRQQEILNNQINQLQNTKLQKAEELQKLESE